MKGGEKMKKRKRRSLLSEGDRIYWVSGKGFLTAQERDEHNKEVKQQQEEERAAEAQAKQEPAPRKRRRVVPTIWK